MKILKYLLTLCLALIFVGCIDYSDGNRTGTLTKFSKKGFVCKTWEGQLNLGGMKTNSEGGMVANVWDFTIDPENFQDQQWIEVLNNALRQGKQVTITYNQEGIVGPCRADTQYFVKKVEVLE
jgi:major membrane immunogen (membrane-anchored lipoprotein)